MAINTYLSIINLNTNGLNPPIKRHKIDSSFISIDWGDISEKNIATSNVWDFYCLYFLLGFLWLQVYHLSLVHFEFISCVCHKTVVWFHFSECICPIFLQVFVQFFQHHLLNKLSLAHCMCWALCQILIDCKGVVYFWVLYSFPLIYGSVLMPATSYSNYYGLIVWFDNRYHVSYNFVLLLWFHIHFWNTCSSSVKYIIHILKGIALNL